MTPPHSHQDRAAEAASYADRLQADLVKLSGMLNHYRDEGGRKGLEDLQRRSASMQGSLELLSQRLDGLGKSADPGKYPLSNDENADLDIARALREQMMDTLSLLQREERQTSRSRKS
jgi:hypothetical protein